MFMYAAGPETVEGYFQKFALLGQKAAPNLLYSPFHKTLPKSGL